MSNVQKLINTFVPQFEAAIRADALASITAQLGKTLAPMNGHVMPYPATESEKAPKLSKVARRIKKGHKRSAAELSAAQTKVLAAIKASGSKGTNAEELKKNLGLELAHIQLPIVKLLETKSIRKTGQKRATRYFVGK